MAKSLSIMDVGKSGSSREFLTSQIQHNYMNFWYPIYPEKIHFVE